MRYAGASLDLPTLAGITRDGGSDSGRPAGRPRPAAPVLNALMRILMIAPEPFFEPRGTPFSEYHRIRALLDLGHTVDLVTYPFGKDVTLPGLRIFRAARPPFITRVKIGPSPAKLFLDMTLTLTALNRARMGQLRRRAFARRRRGDRRRDFGRRSAFRISTTCTRACRSSSRISRSADRRCCAGCFRCSSAPPSNDRA